ncbi:MMPL family transporter [Humibacter ginsenosidimutans]|uniref:MMPL family transporter n=1 Tax=Humibacter ginsenosidimutans TaxID=2599293 RepID=A0A5B8M3C8_9MICO|nr:MMPL family transporter [Humibacter ginsenosidimutans]QDZ15107.1 MMPL family transporter [Humibacter ginsenosidimutans]
MAKWMYRVGAFSARRRWWVIAAWIVLLVVAIASMVAFSKPLDGSITVKGLQSITTLDSVQKTFGGGNAEGRVVFAAPKGSTLTAADARSVAALSSKLAEVHGVSRAIDPFSQPKAGGLAPDRRIGYITVQLDSATLSGTTARGILSAVVDARSPQLEVEAGSDAVGQAASSSNQLPGIVLALIVLLITFGATVAAGMPLLSALVGLGTSITAIYAATSFVSLTSVAPTLALLLGLAVGIDYSLFIVSRHRRQLLDGMSPEESLPLAVGTAGTAVFFAAATVIIALAGLAVENLGFLTQMGLAAAFAVFVAMLVSLTLTPALLALAGSRVITRRARRRLALGEVKRSRRIAAGWIAAVQRRPVVFFLASIVVVAVLAAPVMGMRFGLGNDGTQPSTTTQRKAYDLLAEGFGAGSNGPLEVLATYRQAPTQAEAGVLAQRIGNTKGVSESRLAGLKGDQLLVAVIPKSGPSDAGTVTLVHSLREASLARSLPGSPRLEVTGQTAVDIDISARLAGALPLYLGLIALFAFLLMVAVFRSLLVPLKAAVSFLLSLGASLGVTVAVFQWGWLGGLFGVDPPAPLLAFLPTIVIGVLFGLSMDYEMFLVTGMREHFVHHEGAREAISTGFQQGAKVVVAAALIMIGVFGNGVVEGDSTIRPIAFALAVGIVVDAFVVRMTLVPAVMTLFGKAAWWLPRWLDRIVPNVDVEGSSLGRPVEAPHPVDAMVQ